MCGIAGIFSFNASPIDPEDVANATRSLRHRGPDDEGTWTARNVGLGHRRLSILDLTQSGHQPMTRPGSRYVMVYNGEVYNFRDLRKQLEDRGHSFMGSGDSEVVLCALESWGIDDALRRFKGMFAIALYDQIDDSVILIRDRLGVKPLYYGIDSNYLWFGSELKALQEFCHWTPQLDSEALAQYFSLGYINAPRTIYRNVFKLRPGHWLECKRGEIRERRYWSVLDALAVPLHGTEESLTNELEVLLSASCEARMVSDVPVGVFLSGGIDSSLVTAILQKRHGNIRTFSIGFGDQEFNEAPFAKSVAEHLGTSHTELIVDSGEATKILFDWGALFDEPFADSSGIPTYLVARLAVASVKVALSADGGDELFSGYNVYTSVLNAMNRRDSVHPMVRQLVGGVLDAMPIETADRRLVSSSWIPRSLRGKRRLTWRLARMRDWLGESNPGALYGRTLANSWWANDVRTLIGTEFVADETTASFPGNLAEQMCLWDLHNYLPGDILAKVDRATMATSLEGREPLLDHELVEFAFRLPVALRRGPLGSKHLLRRVLYKYVPQHLVDRPKMGFAVPLGAWLRNDLRTLVGDQLSPGRIKAQAILNPAVVEHTVGMFDAGDHHAVNRVWSLVAFQLWHERWHGQHRASRSSNTLPQEIRTA